MTQQTINRGSAPDDATADTLYVTFGKVQSNFSDLYSVKANASLSNVSGTLPLANIAQGGATSNQALTWNGTAWAPATIAGGGTLTGITTGAGSGLSGGGTSGTLTLTVSFSSTTPAMDGSAAVGTATTAARADHVHPTDTSRLGTSAIPAGTTSQLLGASGSAGQANAITLGAGLSITGTTLNVAAGTGTGTINSGTTGTLAFYAATGTAVSPLTLGTNLSITGTTLNATGGGSSNLSITNTYTASGAIAATDSYALVNSASSLLMTLANGTVDGKTITINNYGTGVVSVTMTYRGVSQALTLQPGDLLNLVWFTTLTSYTLAS